MSAVNLEKTLAQGIAKPIIVSTVTLGAFCTCTPDTVAMLEEDVNQDGRLDYRILRGNRDSVLLQMPNESFIKTQESSRYGLTVFTYEAKDSTTIFTEKNGVFTYLK